MNLDNLKTLMILSKLNNLSTSKSPRNEKTSVKNYQDSMYFLAIFFESLISCPFILTMLMKNVSTMSNENVKSTK
jgi:hypothetical protein